MKNEEHIYGIRAILEALDAEKTINKVYLQKGLQGELFKQLEFELRKKGVSTSYVPIERLNRFTVNNHQGAVASISPIAFHDFEALVEEIIVREEKPLFLLLDHLTDVRNFGAIIRTAECTGVHAIVIPKTGAAPITNDTIKTSAGAAFKIPITKIGHLKDALFYLQASGVSVVAATEKTEQSVYDINFNKPTAIIMGSEGKGINPSILKMVDAPAKLPLLGEIESLNVSVACGVFLYEIVRQRMN